MRFEFWARFAGKAGTFAITLYLEFEWFKRNRYMCEIVKKLFTKRNYEETSIYRLIHYEKNLKFDNISLNYLLYTSQFNMIL